MKLAATAFYIVCMFCYILFSRQPDWFDGERTQATVVERNDSLLAQYNINRVQHFAPTAYLFRNVKPGDRVQVIYEASQPAYATVYSWWGYWIRWQEILVSLLFFFGLMKAATAITSNPTPESLIDQLEGKEDGRKRRYDE
jgi:hypothetical protein